MFPFYVYYLSMLIVVKNKAYLWLLLLFYPKLISTFADIPSSFVVKWLNSAR